LDLRCDGLHYGLTRGWSSRTGSSTALLDSRSTITRHPAMQEMGSDFWTQNVKQQRTRKSQAYSAPHEITHQKIDQVRQSLSENYPDGQSPSPKAALEPPRPGRCQSRAEQQKENSHVSPKRCELLIGRRIKSPDSIKGRPLPDQCRSSKRGHDCAEAQKDTDSSYSTCWRFSNNPIHVEAIAIHHLFSANRNPDGQAGTHPSILPDKRLCRTGNYLTLLPTV